MITLVKVIIFGQVVAITAVQSTRWTKMITFVGVIIFGDHLREKGIAS